MDTLKNLFAIGLLAGVSYWVYQTVYVTPPAAVDDGLAPVAAHLSPSGSPSAEPPRVELGAEFHPSSELPSSFPRTVVGPQGSHALDSGPLASASIPPGGPYTLPPSEPGPGDPPIDAGSSSAGLAVPYTAQPDPAGDNPFPLAFAAARRQIEADQHAEALKLLTEWYDDPRLSTADEAELTSILDWLAAQVVYSRRHVLLPAYEVQPGDQLDRIAEKHQVPWQLLAKINGLSDPRQLRPGDRLKVVPGPFQALVDVRKFQLTLVVSGMYAGRFSIGVGRDGSTPHGEFVVQDKVLNPVWYGPMGVVPHGDPRNPLGDRWLDLGGGIGIHGTNQPTSIGRAESEGCIRLAGGDVEDVFDMLSVGSRVVIQNTAPPLTAEALGSSSPAPFSPRR